MRFHYWKQFLGVLVLSLLIWAVLWTAGIDPLTRARLQNREISNYLAQSASLLERAVRAGSPPNSEALRESKENLAAALVVANDQSSALAELAKERQGPDRKDMLVLLVAVLGGVSTIILSWRKDLREARSSEGQVKDGDRRIVLP